MQKGKHKEKGKGKDKAPGQNKEYVIIVNGREKEFTDKFISFADVVKLAFNTSVNGRTAYTITYKKGEDKKPKGTLAKGDKVKVKSGMIFNVSATDKS